MVARETVEIFALGPSPGIKEAKEKYPSVLELHSTLVRRASLVAQMMKSLPVMWETWARSLGWEDVLKKEMAIHSSILAWKIPWMEEPGRL